MPIIGPQSNANSIGRARPRPKYGPLRLVPEERISPEQKMPYPSKVVLAGHCSKPEYQHPVIATLTYDYQNSTVVLRLLATFVEPNVHDLYDRHAEHLTIPRDWQVMRFVTNFKPTSPPGDNLLALVSAVRRATETRHYAAPKPPTQSSATIRPVAKEVERGPSAPKKEPDTSGPLDPNSPHTKRHTRFTVVNDDRGCCFPRQGERARGHRTSSHR